MGALQKVNLGTPPAADDGDTSRVANTKANINVDILNTQATLTSLSPNAVRDLTAADMGKRINFTPTAAGTVHFPAANTAGADQLVAIHNLSPTYDITMSTAAGSGDTAPTIAVVKAGEMLTYETDGVSVWRTIGRKKAFDETVQGKMTVAGATTLTGPVTLTGGVAGALTATGSLQGASLSIGTGPTYAASISAAGAYSGASASYTGAVTVGGTLGVTGQATFTLRPVFAGNTPWDSGNLASPVTLATSQTLSSKTFSNSTFFTGNPTGNASTSPLVVQTTGGAAQIGFTAASNTLAAVLSLGSSSTFALLSYNSGAYAPLIVSTLTQSSDVLFKENIETLTGVMEKLRELRGVSYTLKADGSAHLGLIAQEVEPLFPELVDTLDMDIDEDGDAIAHQYNEKGEEIFGAAGKPVGRKALGVRYQNMVAPLLQGLLETDAALRSALARIAALEAAK
ncbi:tail fiber domain-containing protein [Paraburkholderia tropica]|uniref:tail fiber domain-containing protein n=1 Tax=Paraburkholderia tropica TaxID=92647 RepID=UPI0031D3CC3C